MQNVSANWAANQSAAFRNLNYGVLIDWTLATASGVNFFTIGTSLIGGNDIIKSGGGVPAYFDKYQYTDYSNYTLNWNVERYIGQYPYGTIMAQADLTLDNNSKLFLPGFDGTIGSGIQPRRPFKLSVGFSGELLNQIVAFTGMPQNHITQDGRQTILHGYDVFDYLNSYKSTASGILTMSGVYTNLRADQIIGDLLTEAGFSSSQYVLDQSLQKPIGYVAPANQLIGDMIQQFCEAEQALAFSDENGIIKFWNRQHFTTISGSGSAFTYSNLQELHYATTPIINDVIVRAQPRTQQALQKVWELSGYITLPPGITVYSMDFTDDFGALPVTSWVTPTTGATSSTYTINTASDGSGSDASGSLAYNSNLSGSTGTLIFNNLNPSATIYITSMIIFGTPAKVTQVIQQRYQDTASIATYGTCPGNNGQTLEIQNDAIQDAGGAASLAYTIVKEFGQPLRRYEKVPVIADPAIQIGDFRTLTNPDTSESFSVYVTGIRTTLDSAGNLQQYLDFEVRNTQHYFTIGTSTIAGADPIAL